jgi:hypothetical protein
MPPANNMSRDRLRVVIKRLVIQDPSAMIAIITFVSLKQRNEVFNVNLPGTRACVRLRSTAPDSFDPEANGDFSHSRSKKFFIGHGGDFFGGRMTIFHGSILFLFRQSERRPPAARGGASRYQHY